LKRICYSYCAPGFTGPALPITALCGTHDGAANLFSLATKSFTLLLMLAFGENGFIFCLAKACDLVARWYLPLICETGPLD
jgi:hypothetical protein